MPAKVNDVTIKIRAEAPILRNFVDLAKLYAYLYKVFSKNTQ